MNLILVLPEHLSRSVSSIRFIQKEEDTVLFLELERELSVVNQHKKKILFLLSSMRHFAKEMEKDGFNVDYRKLDDSGNSGLLEEEIKRALGNVDFEKLIVSKPADYNVFSRLCNFSKKIGVALEVLEDDRFLCNQSDFEKFSRGKKSLRMEFFYRQMRRTNGILMDSDKPVEGRWNFDSDNRKFPRKGIESKPDILLKPDKITNELIGIIEKKFPKNFGEVENFNFAVTRNQALSALKHFIKHSLPAFGDYQDAMLEGENRMRHSQIGMYLNNGLLLPVECVKMAEEAYRSRHAPINSVEGFIRQILGWREFIRGVYWLKMPMYADSNFLECDRKLPQFFWNGDTKMNCLRQCIKETKKYAYAHHIQRLMVLGNFLLLTGVRPREVNDWFLGVYADAHEWVELPNVSGMALFADGGYLASKPYAASGSYIKKMSNYCKNCEFDVSRKTGSGACPFNYLYWDFIRRNRKKIGSNPRMSLIYRTYDKMDEGRRGEITKDSRVFLEQMT